MSSPYSPDDFDRDGMPIKRKYGKKAGSSSIEQGRWQTPQNLPSFGEASLSSEPPRGNSPSWQQSAGQQWGDKTSPVPMNNPYGFSQDVSPISDKNWIVAALLLAFVGGLGVHNFYLGKTNYGIGQLVLNIAGWGLFVSILGIPFALVSWGILSVWLFIEFLILVINGGTDGYGRPMRP